MANQSTVMKAVVLVLAVIGALTVVVAIGMWTMHGSMMGRSMTSNCNAMIAAPRSGGTTHVEVTRSPLLPKKADF